MSLIKKTPSIYPFVTYCVGSEKQALPLEVLRSHFSWIQKNAYCVLPGEPTKLGKPNILLCFDDAYFSFFHFVYPLLKEFSLRALLAVPTHYIAESTSLSPSTRLSVPFSLRMQEGVFEHSAPFCTWLELKEMVLSGHVQVASHGVRHANLNFSFVDLYKEIVSSKNTLEAKLPQVISSFVFPFGKTSSQTIQLVHHHYAYAFRMGEGANRSWHMKGCLSRQTLTQEPISKKFSYYNCTRALFRGCF